MIAFSAVIARWRSNCALTWWQKLPSLAGCANVHGHVHGCLAWAWPRIDMYVCAHERRRVPC
eukprot:7615655-Pyramimonas_sp.AAC.1